MASRERALSWGHINLNVQDLEVAISFYEKLGFAVMLPGIPYLDLEREGLRSVPDGMARAMGLPLGTRGRACILRLGEGFPMLDLTAFERGEGEALETASATTASASGGLGFVRICLATRDLAAESERLRALGVPFLTSPCEHEEGLAKVALCRDPDGNLIELIEIDLAKWAPPA